MRKMSVLVVMMLFLVPLVLSEEKEPLTQDQIDQLNVALQQGDFSNAELVQQALDEGVLEYSDLTAMFSDEKKWKDFVDKFGSDWTKINGLQSCPDDLLGELDIDSIDYWDKIPTNLRDNYAAERGVFLDSTQGNVQFKSDGSMINGPTVLNLNDFPKDSNINVVAIEGGGFKIGDNNIFSLENVPAKANFDANKEITGYSFGDKSIEGTDFVSAALFEDGSIFIVKDPQDDGIGSNDRSVSFSGVNKIVLGEDGNVLLDDHLNIEDAWSVTNIQLSKGADGKEFLDLKFSDNTRKTVFGTDILDKDNVLRLYNDQDQYGLDISGTLNDANGVSTYLSIDGDKFAIGSVNISERTYYDGSKEYLKADYLSENSVIFKPSAAGNYPLIVTGPGLKDLEYAEYPEKNGIYMKLDSGGFSDIEIGQTFEFGSGLNTLSYNFNDDGNTESVHVYGNNAKASTSYSDVVLGQSNSNLNPSIQGTSFDLVFAVGKGCEDDASFCSMLAGYFPSSACSINIDGSNLYESATIPLSYDPVVFDQAGAWTLGNADSNGIIDQTSISVDQFDVIIPPTEYDKYVAVIGGVQYSISNSNDLALLKSSYPDAEIMPRSVVGAPTKEEYGYKKKMLEDQITVMNEILFTCDSPECDDSAKMAEYNNELAALQERISALESSYTIEPLAAGIPTTAENTVKISDADFIYVSQLQIGSEELPKGPDMSAYYTDKFKNMYGDKNTLPEGVVVTGMQTTVDGFSYSVLSDGGLWVHDERNDIWYTYDSKRWNTGKIEDARTAANLRFIAETNNIEKPGDDVKNSDVEAYNSRIQPALMAVNNRLDFSVGPSSTAMINAAGGSSVYAVDGSVYNSYSEITGQNIDERRPVETGAAFNDILSIANEKKKNNEMKVTVSDGKNVYTLGNIGSSAIGSKYYAPVLGDDGKEDPNLRIMFDEDSKKVTLMRRDSTDQEFKSVDSFRPTIITTSPSMAIPAGITGSVRDDVGQTTQAFQYVGGSLTTQTQVTDKTSEDVTGGGKDGDNQEKVMTPEEIKQELDDIQKKINQIYKDANCGASDQACADKLFKDNKELNDLVKRRNELKGESPGRIETDSKDLDDEKVKKGNIVDLEEQLAKLKQKKAINDLTLAAGPDLLSEEARKNLEEENKRLDKEISSLNDLIKKESSGSVTTTTTSGTTTTTTMKKSVTDSKGGKYTVNGNDILVSVTPQAGGNTYYNKGNGWYYIQDGKTIYVDIVVDKATGNLKPGAQSTMSQETLDVLNKAYLDWDANKKASSGSVTTTTSEQKMEKYLEDRGLSKDEKKAVHDYIVNPGEKEEDIRKNLELWGYTFDEIEEMIRIRNDAVIFADAGSAQAASTSRYVLAEDGYTYFKAADGKYYKVTNNVIATTPSAPKGELTSQQQGIKCTTDPKASGCASTSAAFEKEFKDRYQGVTVSVAPYVKFPLVAKENNIGYTVDYYDDFVDRWDMVQVRTGDGRTFVRQVDTPGVWYTLKSDGSLVKYSAPAGSNDAVIFADADKKAATVTGR